MQTAAHLLTKSTQLLDLATRLLVGSSRAPDFFRHASHFAEIANL